MRSKAGEVGGWTHAGQPTQETRIPDSVIRVRRHKGKIGQDIDHPAVFPVALPEFVIEAYSEKGDIVFERASLPERKADRRMAWRSARVRC